MMIHNEDMGQGSKQTLIMNPPPWSPYQKLHTTSQTSSDLKRQLWRVTFPPQKIHTPTLNIKLGNFQIQHGCIQWQTTVWDTLSRHAMKTIEIIATNIHLERDLHMVIVQKRGGRWDPLIDEKAKRGGGKGKKKNRGGGREEERERKEFFFEKI
jgi:hypothetical protein